jgi:hypothetical protein
MTASTLTVWEAGQAKINSDQVLFAGAKRFGSPIVTFNNTNVLIDGSLVADPRSVTGISTALARLGRSIAGYDFVISINVDPSRTEGGFAAGRTPAFIYMGNIGPFKAPLRMADVTQIAGAVYYHEVAHHWGWPGTHDWTNGGCQANAGWEGVNPLTKPFLPPLLFGWEDLDGDGVPEILDQTPYGRSRP